MACRTCLRAANAVMTVAAIATALAVFGPSAWSMATAPRLPVIDPEAVARRSAILDAQLEVLRDRQRELGLISGRSRVAGHGGAPPYDGPEPSEGVPGVSARPPVGL